MSDPERPPLKIVRGNPTPEELAALAALMAAGGADAEPVERVRRGGWSDPSGQHRRELRPGPNAWRASARP